MTKRKSTINRSAKRKSTENTRSRNGFIFIISIFLIIIGVCFFYRDRISLFYSKHFKIPKTISNLLNRNHPSETPPTSEENRTEGQSKVNRKQRPQEENRHNEPETIEAGDDKQSDKEYLHAMTATLYFIKIENESNLELIPTRRNINFNTTLLSVRIKKNVAYLNFSEDFEYNGLGKESTISQLKQIVYTVTEFKNIKAVQFLIEGKQKKYLGGEGILINYPLSRNDFS